MGFHYGLRLPLRLQRDTFFWGSVGIRKSPQMTSHRTMMLCNGGFFARLATRFSVLGAPGSILPRSYVHNEHVVHLSPPVSLSLTLEVATSKKIQALRSEGYKS